MKNTKKSNRFKNDAKTYFILAGVVVFVAIFMPKYGLLFGGMDLLSKNEALRETESNIVQAESVLQDERDFYRTEKEKYNVAASRNEEAIAEILPNKIARTDITRTVEEFLNELAKTSGKEVMFKTINFSRPKQEKGDDFQTLPFRVSLSTKKSNLPEILRFFEKTGRITANPDDAERLMNVETINIQFLDDKNGIGSLDKDINLDLMINAYTLNDSAKS